MADNSSRTRIDLGRIVMVPATAIVLLLVVVALIRQGGGDALRWSGTLLTIAFYGQMIWCYLRRGPAVATTRSITGRAAAVVATWTPLLVIPLVRGAPAGAVEQGAADMLLLAGSAWSVWSLHFLGRNLSIIAQARGVADQGPYRWVRHPLYTGEIVSALGLAMAANSLAAIAVWLVFCGLQAYRARREEQLLLLALPGYRAYRDRTAALLPGIF